MSIIQLLSLGLIGLLFYRFVQIPKTKKYAVWERAALLLVMAVIGGFVYKGTIGGARSDLYSMLAVMGAVSGLGIAVLRYREKNYFEAFVFLCFTAGCLVS